MKYQDFVKQKIKEGLTLKDISVEWKKLKEEESMPLFEKKESKLQLEEKISSGNQEEDLLLNSAIDSFSSEPSKHYIRMVLFYKKQLNEKDKEIAELKGKLNKFLKAVEE